MRSLVRSCAAVMVVALISASGFAQSTQPAQQPTNVLPLYESVNAEIPNLRARGKALLTFFGFRVYNGTLWTTGGGGLNAPFALDLQYLRNFEGEALAKRSVDEMRGQGIGTETQYEKWMKDMIRAFPNVKANDRITGVHLPGKGAKFFHNGKLTAEINDTDFARAFFDIWLSPKTSQPAMRSELLGEK